MKIGLYARIQKTVGTGEDKKKVFSWFKVQTEQRGRRIPPNEPPQIGDYVTPYFLRYTENGQRKMESIGKNFREAVTLLRARQDRLLVSAAGGDVSKMPEIEGRLTIAEAVEKFIRYNAAKGRATATRQAYKRVAEEFRDVCGQTYVGAVTRDTVLEYVAWCRENVKTRAGGSRNGMIITRLQHLASMWTVANGRKLTFPLPWSEWPKAEKATVKTFTDEELNRILSKASVDESDLFLLSMSTGMRAGELGYVFYSDVNFKTGVVTVTNKPALNWRTKDGNPREAGTLSADVLARIKARRKRHSAADDSPIFTNSKGRPVPGSRITKVFRAMAARAGFTNAFPAGQGNHKLRKTYGTRIAKMKSPTTAQKLLGHDNLATTMRYLEAETVKQGEADDLFAGVGK